MRSAEGRRKDSRFEVEGFLRAVPVFKLECDLKRTNDKQKNSVRSRNGAVLITGGLVVLALAVCLAVKGSPPTASDYQPSEDETQPAPQPDKTPDKSLSSFLNLHQWGAVTLFHGLPSDHVRAIAQDLDGTLWLGTDGGLAKYDGRRIQKVSASGMQGGRVRALLLDPDGELWIGTDYGAGRLSAKGYRPIEETNGQQIGAIEMTGKGEWVLGSDSGMVYRCSEKADRVQTRSVGPHDSALLTVDANRAVPIEITSLGLAEGSVVLGTSSRGLLRLDDVTVKEEFTRPRPFFVKAFASDSDGHVWMGADAAPQDSGLYQGSSLARLQKVGSGIGAVTSISLGPNEEAWVGTEKQGVLHFKTDREVDHFTFDNTAGGLRSNLVYCVFRDREGVLWFGTDRGVCRYDPGSPHAERLSADPQSNFVRVVYKTTDGSIWCGTNRGLFYRESPS
ncbi:MAG TPA: two-component regulator propeller domain-containing protein, partial [Blastocatellia bacterium]